MTYKRRQASAATSGGGAPVGAQFITSATDPTLTAERVLTDTATVTWDFTTPGQAKATAAGATPQNTFLNIAVATQPTIVADTSTDTLTIVAGANVTLTTDATTDTLTIAAVVPAAAPLGAQYIVSSADPALTAERVLTDTATVTWDFATAGQAKATATAAAQNTFSNIAVATQPTIVADTSTDTLTIVAGSGITLTTDATTDTLTIAASGGPAYSPSGFNVRKSTGQSLGTLGFVKIIFDVESFDSDGTFDSVTNYRHTPTVAGNYMYNVSGEFNNPTLGSTTRLLIYKNGVGVFGSLEVQANAGDNTAISVGGALAMNGTTDFVEFFAQHNGPGTITLVASSVSVPSTFATGFRIV